MASGFDDEAEEELLALQSIYEDKLNLEDEDENRNIRITIHPATADDADSQYVCLEILFTLSMDYPRKQPKISFAMSRGLSDHHLDNLLKRMHDFTKERTGECILFDLMEMAKDILTSNNIPSCPCSICLMSFHECDDFLKTKCYHYFHSFCLCQYLEHQVKQDVKEDAKRKPSPQMRNEYTVPCPVCRLSVSLHFSELQKAQPPINDESVNLDDSVMGRQKQKYNEHYQRQLKNGGLIDLEYEKNKYLLSHIEQNYQVQKASISETGPDGAEPSEPVKENKPTNTTTPSKKGNTPDQKTGKGAKAGPMPKHDAYFYKGKKSPQTNKPQSKSQHPQSQLYHGKNNSRAPMFEKKKSVHRGGDGSKGAFPSGGNLHPSNTKTGPHQRIKGHRGGKTGFRTCQYSKTNGDVHQPAYAKEIVPERTEARPNSGYAKSKAKATHRDGKCLQHTSTTYKPVHRPPGFPMKPPPGFENVKPAKRIPLS